MIFIWCRIRSNVDYFGAESDLMQILTLVQNQTFCQLLFWCENNPKYWCDFVPSFWCKIKSNLVRIFWCKIEHFGAISYFNRNMTSTNSTYNSHRRKIERSQTTSDRARFLSMFSYDSSIFLCIFLCYKFLKLKKLKIQFSKYFNFLQITIFVWS